MESSTISASLPVLSGRALDEPAVVAALAALAQPARLRLFRALVVAGTQGLTPGRLGELLALPGSTLSFHLKELTHAGLVAAQRDGRSLIYRASYARMRDLLGYLTAHCCQGQGCGEPQPADSGSCNVPAGRR